MAKYIFRYIGSLCLCLTWAVGGMAGNVVAAESSDSIAVVSEKNLEATEAIDEPAKNPKEQVYQGTYINVDVFNPIYTACLGNRFEFEASVDVGLWHRLFPKIEFGYQSVFENPEVVDYHSNGFFLRAGADFNLMNYSPTRKYDHSLYLGLRYGYAYTSYSLGSVEAGSDYWGESGMVQGQTLSYNSGWIEGVFGVRAEVCPHFLIGLAAHVKFVSHAYGKSIGLPAYIPGYGKTGGSSANFSLSWTLTYQIPY
ncbi:MAG: hypothetical protein J5808_04600 [Paludibacteraceae bacterium]|nr:hypothetical protein [Paludibacteraceae bacterium]